MDKARQGGGWATLLALPLMVGPAGCFGPSQQGVHVTEGSREADGARPWRPRAGKADAGCAPSPSWYYRHLDDTECTKRLPSDRDREWTCPNVALSAETVRADTGERVRYQRGDRRPIVDPDGLSGIAPDDDVRMAAILVRRVEGVPHYRYLGNGRQDDIVQPWSSTKFLAIAHGAAGIRRASAGLVGLDGEAPGALLGDLSTIVHGYDEREHTSNGVARWFLDVGGRADADALIGEAWLGRPSAESFGGNYGAPSADLPFEVHGARGAVSLTPDASTGYANQLSMMTVAEALKRLVMHREDPGVAMPDLQWADVQALLYGAEGSPRYAAAEPQGMEADTAVYVQQALDVDDLERRSEGRWRVFGKLGHGPSRGGEFVHVAYACLPEIDPWTGLATPDEGLEVFLATHLSARGRFAEGDQRMAEIYADAIGRMRNGRIR